eukprot:TRINITY_DN2923_c0_g1_i2.p2 TRINITY_DN2923_c0_g1~~TRINITY_DN2923_c0_g1_i2.p2  ORF type:complete len:164 (-),score=39.97 TRINITY_DN2923_c0_g1_i2:372-863(-)
MQRGLVGSEMCIRDRYQRRVHGKIIMMEVTEMIDSISKQKQLEKERLDSLNFRTIKDMKRKSYIPRIKTDEEIMQEARIKKSWRDAGAHPQIISKIPIIKGGILNEWEAMRTIMPERNYKIPKGSMPIKYTRLQADFFPKPGQELCAQRFKDRLQTFNSHFKV